jgi:hypothetical protein
VRKIMLIGDCAERAITNVAKHVDVLTSRTPNLDVCLSHV